jgi:hypothetical protein
VVGHQRAAARLSAREALQPGVYRGDGGLELIDLPEPDRDGLT